MMQKSVNMTGISPGRTECPKRLDLARVLYIVNSWEFYLDFQRFSFISYVFSEFKMHSVRTIAETVVDAMYLLSVHQGSKILWLLPTSVLKVSTKRLSWRATELCGLACTCPVFFELRKKSWNVPKLTASVSNPPLLNASNLVIIP